MAKKTLAEQIADLQKPENPDFDIEDSERGVFDHEDKSDESDADLQEEEELKSQHYVKVGKSKLRDHSANIKDPKYAGKASSRSDIFGGSDAEEGSSTFEEEDDDSEEISEEESDQNHPEGEVSEEDEESDNASQQEDDNDSGVSLTDSEDEDSEASEPETENEEAVSSKRDKLRQLMANERKHILNRVSTTTQTDALKGFAVINQQRLFDTIIDSRIKLQKAITSSNSLPTNNEIFEEFKEEETDKKLSQVEKSLHSLLDNILSLRTTIYNKDSLTKERFKFKTNKKRTFEDYVEETKKLDDVLNKQRDSVLTKWSHKVQSASGATALNASKFKTINQSAAQQVQVNLLDMDRLIKRTRLNRRNVKPLGFVEEESDEKDTVDRGLKEDENIFDDEDFYRVLLNDLVDKKISDANPVNGLTIQLTKSKVKKNVDTKASKGRKLKYTVQEQIQNYEAPKGNFKWSDEQIDEFFAGLLGQKVDFNEELNDSESEEDDQLKGDDLRVFG